MIDENLKVLYLIVEQEYFRKTIRLLVYWTEEKAMVKKISIGFKRLENY
jgi:hypothetical protein